jgi:hypothetical protein
MGMPVIVGMAIVVLLVVVRHFAARRVVARHGWFVWLMFIPTLIGGVAILWASIQALASAPVFGVLMAVAGAIYLALLIRFLTRLSRSVSATGPDEDLGLALTEPVVDYMSTMVGLVLIGAGLAVVALIIWGVSQAG